MSATTGRPVALVTGASSGIGAAFAVALAARGDDLVVVARRTELLGDLAARLRAEHDTTTEVIGADLSTEGGMEVVAQRLSDRARPVELLVNSAGFGSVGRLWELPEERELAMVALNVVCVARLTHAALGPMVARGSGGVINLSSVTAYQPVPMHATYGASKAFVSSFTNAVHEELRGTGVKAMVLTPGYTRTGFQSEGFDPARLPEFLWETAEDVVATALRAYERGRAVCITGAFNVALSAASSAMPAGVTRRVARMVTRRVY